MNNYSPQTPPPYFGQGGQQAVVHQTNSVLTRVYLRMFIGLLISAFCALGVASSPTLAALILGNKIIFWGSLIALFAIAFILPARINRMSSTTTLFLFMLYSALMGVWMAPIFFAYKMGTIAYTFFVTAGTFGAMSVYGYFTKRDLSRFGTYLMMGLFGLMFMIIINLFVPSGAFNWIVSIVGVLIFIGLTAYDTQMIKRMCAANLDPSMADKLATIGAMNLYMDFINMFIFLLRIFGGSRD